MLAFPINIPPPLVPYATGGGDSYKLSVKDSTITATTEGGYKITRPRNTRRIRTWTYTWGFLSDEDFASLERFYMKVGQHEIFSFTHPGSGEITHVRMVGDFTSQCFYPSGWQVTLCFEEV